MIADRTGRRQHKSTTRVSIVVPTVRVDDRFLACLDSISRLNPACDELVVVSDGGGDDIRQAAEAYGARAVMLPQNRGPATARNAGACAASGDILFFVDADVTVPPDALRRVVRAFEDEPNLTGVIGSYDDEPGSPEFFSQYKNLAHHFVHQQARRESTSFWSACGAVRREAFEKLGGFDDRIRRSSIEDIELGARMIDAGHLIRLDRDIQVKHLKRWAPWSLVMSDFRDRAVPWTRLILRRGKMPDDLNLRWKGRVAVAAACALALAFVLVPVDPRALFVAVAFGAVLLVIDRAFLLFLARHRGWWFAVRAAGAHWVHYLCSAAGLATGIVLHLTSRQPWPPPVEVRSAEGPETR